MKLKHILIITLSTLASVFALAGLTQPAPVVVDLDNGTAFGDMVTARFSDNDVEFIGCGVRVFDDGAGGSFQFGFCQAADSEGVNAFCNTDNPALLEAMKSTADFSFVTFSFDEEGVCNRIGFSTQSFYIPEGVGPDDDSDSDSDSDSD